MPAGDDATEHAVYRGAIQRLGVDGDADNPARVLIHDNHYPMRFQYQRLASEEEQRPQTVLGMPEKCQPGWAAIAVIWTKVPREHSPDDVLVDFRIQYE